MLNVNVNLDPLLTLSVTGTRLHHTSQVIPNPWELIAGYAKVSVLTITVQHTARCRCLGFSTRNVENLCCVNLGIASRTSRRSTTVTPGAPEVAGIPCVSGHSRPHCE